MAETMEYSELLDSAAKAKDSIERLVYITAFAVASYSKYKYRSSRKPFNPLLGETYELVRPDKGKYNDTCAVAMADEVLQASNLSPRKSCITPIGPLAMRKAKAGTTRRRLRALRSFGAGRSNVRR